jgi:hypothetical protein
MSIIQSAIFIGASPGLVVDNPSNETDSKGSLTVSTGAAGGTSNPGAGVLAAIRNGMVPLPVQTAGYTTAHASAVTAVAAIGASPTQAQIQAALTSVLATIAALARRQGPSTDRVCRWALADVGAGVEACFTHAGQPHRCPEERTSPQALRAVASGPSSPAMSAPIS